LGYVKLSETEPLRKSETTCNTSIDYWPVSYGISIKNGYATQVFPGIYDKRFLKYLVKNIQIIETNFMFHIVET